MPSGLQVGAAKRASSLECVDVKVKADRIA